MTPRKPLPPVTEHFLEQLEEHKATQEKLVGWMLAFVIIFYVFLLMWAVAGLVALGMSIFCFTITTNNTDNVLGLILALLFGPFYWIFYWLSPTYCKRTGVFGGKKRRL